MDRVGSCDRTGSVPIPGLQGPEVGDQPSSTRDRRRARRGSGRQHDQRSRSEPQAVHRAEGKLIQYHGWSDPQISPEASVQYYQRVLAALAAPTTWTRRIACSWLQAWGTAVVATAPTPSTWSPLLSSGSNRARRRIRSSRHARPRASSSERDRSVLIPKSPHTKAQAVQTTPRTSCAR